MLLITCKSFRSRLHNYVCAGYTIVNTSTFKVPSVLLVFSTPSPPPSSISSHSLSLSLFLPLTAAASAFHPLLWLFPFPLVRDTNKDFGTVSRQGRCSKNVYARTIRHFPRWSSCKALIICNFHVADCHILLFVVKHDTVSRFMLQRVKFYRHSRGILFNHRCQIETFVFEMEARVMIDVVSSSR